MNITAAPSLPAPRGVYTRAFTFALTRSSRTAARGLCFRTKAGASRSNSTRSWATSPRPLPARPSLSASHVSIWVCGSSTQPSRATGAPPASRTSTDGGRRSTARGGGLRAEGRAGYPCRAVSTSGGGRPATTVRRGTTLLRHALEDRRPRRASEPSSSRRPPPAPSPRRAPRRYDPAPLLASLRPWARAALPAAAHLQRLDQLPLYSLTVSLAAGERAFSVAEELWFTNNERVAMPEVVLRVYANAARREHGDPPVRFVTGRCVPRRLRRPPGVAVCDRGAPARAPRPRRVAAGGGRTAGDALRDRQLAHQHPLAGDGVALDARRGRVVGRLRAPRHGRRRREHGQLLRRRRAQGGRALGAQRRRPRGRPRLRRPRQRARRPRLPRTAHRSPRRA